MRKVVSTSKRAMSGNRESMVPYHFKFFMFLYANRTIWSISDENDIENEPTQEIGQVANQMEYCRFLDFQIITFLNQARISFC